MKAPASNGNSRHDMFQGIEQAAIDAIAESATLQADVLAVDDNALLLKMYIRKAKKSGLSIEAVSDGNAAVELARQGKRYGIVLMDKQMVRCFCSCAPARDTSPGGCVTLCYWS